MGMPALKLKNRRFNYLKVIERANHPKIKAVFWKCLCDCGNTTLVESSDLTHNKTQSCGCQQGKKKLKYGESTLNALLSNYKAGAKRRGIKFLLSKKRARNLFQANCFYCGSKPLNVRKDKGRHGEFKFNGIDRINNSKGYTKENSISCCKNCNLMKHKLKVDDFLIHVSKIYRNWFDKEVLEEYKKNNKDSWQNVKIED